MFSGCRMFDGRGLDKWNTSNVTDMSAMFGGCQWFNANLGNWDVSNV
jgi:surface protein